MMLNLTTSLLIVVTRRRGAGVGRDSLFAMGRVIKCKNLTFNV